MLNKCFHHHLGLTAGIVTLAASSLALAQEPSFDPPAGTLYYSGLVDEVWQIFSLKIPNGKPVQLTHTASDKREPFWLPGKGKLVARDSSGDIILIRSEGGCEKFGHFELPTANFSFFSDGSNLLMTHLSSKSYRKQWIYSGRIGEESTKLFAKPVTGSYCRVRISPDNEWFACTMIQTLEEERLVVGEIANPSNVRLLTPEGSLASYPAWSPDGKMVYFSMRRAESQSWDLCSAEVGSGEVTCLASTPAVDEVAPCADPSGKGLFFQCSGGYGFEIGYLDLASRRSSKIGGTGNAREPFFRADMVEVKGRHQ
jgi:hypothetical protein